MRATAATALTMLVLAAPALAQGGGTQRCRAIADDLQRLACEYSTPAPPPGLARLDAAAFAADWRKLVGKPVEVAGFGVLAGMDLNLFARKGDETCVFVDLGNLSRTDRRFAFSNCPFGCEMRVVGKAIKRSGKGAIVAAAIARP
jgi:hypothetical protein